MEAHMFCYLPKDKAGESSFLYLMLAASYFRQATQSRHSHIRRALRDLGREYIMKSYGAAPIREAETTGVPWTVDETKTNAKHVPKAKRSTKITPTAAAAVRLLLFGERVSNNGVVRISPNPRMARRH